MNEEQPDAEPQPRPKVIRRYKEGEHTVTVYDARFADGYEGNGKTIMQPYSI
jgi:hypothetical protein